MGECTWSVITKNGGVGQAGCCTGRKAIAGSKDGGEAAWGSPPSILSASAHTRHGGREGSWPLAGKKHKGAQLVSLVNWCGQRRSWDHYPVARRRGREE